MSALPGISLPEGNAAPGDGLRARLSWTETRHAAKVLRKARLESGIQQVSVARALGWNPTKACHAESALFRMTRGEALAFAEVVGIDGQALGLEGPR